VLRVLSWVPGVGKSMSVVLLDRQIERLEDRGELERARTLRCTALKALPSKLAGPLWRSEGFDRLQNRNDYAGALEAFTNAMEVMEQAPFLTAATGPERVWYGAAVSALKTGDVPRARELYVKLRHSLNDMPRWAKSGEGWRKYQDCAEWLERNLPREPSSAPNSAKHSLQTDR
jgi:hypothetical protein